MRKLLLSLGSMTIIAAPLTTVIACSNEQKLFSGEGILDGSILNISGMQFNTEEEMTGEVDVNQYIGFLNGFADLLENDDFVDATIIKTSKSIFEIINFDSTNGGPMTPSSLGDLVSFEWNETVASEGTIELSSRQNMALTIFAHLIKLEPSKDATGVISSLESLSLISQIDKPLDDATNEKEAEYNFGLSSVEYRKIIDILSSEWEFRRIDKLFSYGGTISVHFHHKDEVWNEHWANIPITWK